jgi:hypothetical protein
VTREVAEEGVEMSRATLIVCLLTVACWFGTDLAAAQPPAGGGLTGVYHWDAPNGPRLVDAVGVWTGRNQDLAVAYAPRENWNELHSLGWQLPAWGAWVNARAGRRLAYGLGMLVGPADRSGPDTVPGTSDDVSLAACGSGQYDAHFRAVAQQMASAGLTNSVIRLGWEFDGDWFAWSSRGREREYASCFRRIVDTMRGTAGASAFVFEWSSSDDIFFTSPSAIEAAWPGDDYVDLIGVNAYDVSWVAGSYPFPSPCDTSCLASHRKVAWDDMMRGVYQQRDRAIARNKKLAIPEWGIWNIAGGHGGGDNADYVARMHAFVSDPNNRVFYQAYFDVNYVDGGHQLSDVAGGSSDSGAGHTYQTAFPQAAAKYRALFGAASAPARVPALPGRSHLLALVLGLGVVIARRSSKN